RASARWWANRPPQAPSRLLRPVIVPAAGALGPWVKPAVVAVAPIRLGAANTAPHPIPVGLPSFVPARSLSVAARKGAPVVQKYSSVPLVSVEDGRFFVLAVRRSVVPYIAQLPGASGQPTHALLQDGTRQHGIHDKIDGQIRL